jgi:hypothetical protein
MRLAAAMRSSSNPYNGFKDDRERRLALRSRDIRLTLIAIVCAIGGGFGQQLLRGVAWLAGW